MDEIKVIDVSITADGKLTGRLVGPKKFLIKNNSNLTIQNNQTKEIDPDIFKVGNILKLVQEELLIHNKNGKKVVRRIFEVMPERSGDKREMLQRVDLHDDFNFIDTYFEPVTEEDLNTLKLLYDFDEYEPAPLHGIASNRYKHALESFNLER